LSLLRKLASDSDICQGVIPPLQCQNREVVSRVGFLRCGLFLAALKAVGNGSELRGVLIRVVRTGRMSPERHAFLSTNVFIVSHFGSKRLPNALNVDINESHRPKLKQSFRPGIEMSKHNIHAACCSIVVGEASIYQFNMSSFISVDMLWQFYDLVQYICHI